MSRGSQHEQYMKLALEQAEAAARLGEVPVGAVLVHDGNVVARAHNRREIAQDPLAHAEILCLSRAAKAMETWRLTGATLYVTLEPCPMCAGALINARVDRVVYGCADPKAGAVRTLYALCEDPRLNHRVEVVRGVLSEQCSAILSEFFAQLRARSAHGKGKKPPAPDRPTGKNPAIFTTAPPPREREEPAPAPEPAHVSSRPPAAPPRAPRAPVAPRAPARAAATRPQEPRLIPVEEVTQDKLEVTIDEPPGERGGPDDSSGDTLGWLTDELPEPGQEQGKTMGWIPGQRGVDPSSTRDYPPSVNDEGESRRPDKK